MCLLPNPIQFIILNKILFKSKNLNLKLMNLSITFIILTLTKAYFLKKNLNFAWSLNIHNYFHRIPLKSKQMCCCVLFEAINIHTLKLVLAALIFVGNRLVQLFFRYNNRVIMWCLSTVYMAAPDKWRFVNLYYMKAEEINSSHFIQQRQCNCQSRLKVTVKKFTKTNY